MATKVTITITEDFSDENHVKEVMNIDYELDKDAEGMILVNSNALGIGRTVLELFRCGALHSLTQGFVPASMLPTE